jgi:hypothetical protein
LPFDGLRNKQLAHSLANPRGVTGASIQAFSSFFVNLLNREAIKCVSSGSGQCARLGVSFGQCAGLPLVTLGKAPGCTDSLVNIGATVHPLGLSGTVSVTVSYDRTNANGSVIAGSQTSVTKTIR